jgi:uncharacterized protein YraI
MQSYTKFFKLFILVCLVSLVSVGPARQAFASPQESVPSFPYIAEITADNVNIRSGPGTNYYRCGRLDKADRVKVVGSQFSWSRIVPPPGSFSWISKQYVSIDRNNPTIGIVTGDAVRVYAGSELLKPIHSTTVQLKLNRDDKVRLMGEEKGDYYKIAPPAGSYLWLSTKYTESLGPVGKVPLIVAPKVEPKTDTGVVVYTKASVEARKLKEYQALQRRIEAERAKPMAQQNYVNIKKAILEIADNKEAGKATRYSAFAIKQIERYELALAAGKQVRLQELHLQRIEERIEKARLRKLAQVPELGQFAVIGWFQISSIYGEQAELKLYRIIDDSGKILCYALPEGPASKTALSNFVGRKVGLVGIIEPHLQTSKALVRFAEIVNLQ